MRFRVNNVIKIMASALWALGKNARKPVHGNI